MINGTVLCVLISFFLAPELNQRSAHFMGALLFALLPFSFTVSSYNTWYLLFVALGSTLLFRGYRTAAISPNRAISFFLMSGILLGLAAYVYSSGLFLCLILVAILLLKDICQVRKNHGKLYSLWVVLGGILAAGGILFQAVVLRGFSFHDLFVGIQNILSNGYTEITRSTMAQRLPYITSLLLFGPFLAKLPGLFLLIVFALSAYCGSRTFEKRIHMLPTVGNIYHCLLKLTLICMSLALIGLTVLIIGVDSFHFRHLSLELISLFPLILYPHIRNNKQLAKEMLLYIYLPVFLSFVAAGAIAFDGYSTRTYFLLFGGLLCIPFCKWIWDDYFPKAVAISANAVQIVFCFSILVNLISSSFAYIYRDVPISQMDTRISEGVYKGIYTSSDRVEQVVTLERLIRDNTAADESVVFLGDWNTAGALMTDAHVTSFTTLAPVGKDGGPEGTALLLDSLELSERPMPDKFIFFNSIVEPTVDFSRLDGPDYPLRSVLDQQYTLTCEDTSHGYGFRVYTHN